MNNLPLPEVKEIPPCQWTAQLENAINTPAKFERLWNDIHQPKRECVVYDWQSNEVI